MSARSLLLPLLVVLMVTVVVAGMRGSGGEATPEDPEARPGTTEVVAPTPPALPESTATPAATASGAPQPTTEPRPTLPAVTPVEIAGFTYASGAGRVFGQAPHRRFAVAVEQQAGVELAELVGWVDETLADPRSWIGDTVTGFERVDPDSDDLEFTIVVATPATVDRLCAPLNTGGVYSCGNNGWIALNLDRWNTATETWPADLDTYRRYLLNHEVGHYVLGPDHPGCPAPGTPAPIMMQQTIDLGGCAANGWVYPD